MKPDISTFAKFYKAARCRVNLSKSSHTGLWDVSSVQNETGAGMMTWKTVFSGLRRTAQVRYRTEISRQGYWLLWGGSIRSVPLDWIMATGGPRDVLRRMWGDAQI